MTYDQLIKIGFRTNIAEDSLQTLNSIIVNNNLDTKQKIAYFIAQIAHESSYLMTLKENLNYSASSLTKVFPKYFTKLEAFEYTRQPRLIANKVYANRMGNGDELSGDGYLFRGRGAIQITGRLNYTTLSNDTGIDCVDHPEILEELLYALISASWYWSSNKLDQITDFERLTRKINGGLNGYEDRKAILTKCLNIL